MERNNFDGNNNNKNDEVKKEENLEDIKKKDDSNGDLNRAVTWSLNVEREREARKKKKNQEKSLTVFPHQIIFKKLDDDNLENLFGRSIACLSPFPDLSKENQALLKADAGSSMEIQLKNAAEFLSRNYGYPITVARIFAEKIVYSETEFSDQERKQIEAEICSNIASFFENAVAQKSEVIVISFGTADSRLQMCPPFLSEFLKASVLNIDPLIYNKESQAILEIYNNKPGLYIRGSTISCMDRTDYMYPILLEYIDKHLKSSDIPLVITYHLGAPLSMLFVELAKQYAEQMRAGQLLLVHGYSDYQPAVIYSPEYLTSDSFENAFNNFKKERCIGSIANAIFKGNRFESFEALQKALEKDISIKGDNIFFVNYEVVKIKDLILKKIASKKEANLEKQIQEKEPLEVVSILIKEKRVDLAKKFIDENKDILNMKDKVGRTLAHIAVIHNVLDDPSIISFLYERGVDFTAPDMHGITPLEFVAWNAGSHVAQELISIGVHENVDRDKLSKIAENAKECRRNETVSLLEVVIQTKPSNAKPFHK